jgi:hypothetical protein
MGCFARNSTTLTVGRGFEPTEVPDRYFFRLRANDRMDAATADRSAAREMRDFQKIERYVSYEIEGRRYSVNPSYYEYTVQFSRS